MKVLMFLFLSLLIFTNQHKITKGHYSKSIESNEKLDRNLLEQEAKIKALTGTISQSKWVKLN